MPYDIEPLNEPRGLGCGWEPCEERDATCFAVRCLKTDDVVSAHDLRAQAEEYIALNGDQYTRRVTVHGDGITLDLMVKPDTDFDSAFKAWDRDAEEFIRVAGWLVDEIEEVAA